MTSAGRKVLLGTVGEAEFTRAVKRWAWRQGWCGYHVRYSQGVVEGIHTLANSDHSDAEGFPDWILAKAGHPLLIVELKTDAAPEPAKQKRWIGLFNAVRGLWSGFWRPRMEDEIRRTLES